MNMHDDEIFINRELSWIQFNSRVLELAKDKSVPLGEQLKFASIFASNLDEFFMVRVGSLYDRMLLKEDQVENKTKMTAAQQLESIIPAVSTVQQYCDKITDKLFDKLEKYGFYKADFSRMNKETEQRWKKYFQTELSPVLSPQIIDRRHPFPFLRNQEMYIGVELKAKGSTTSFGIIPVSNQFSRIIYLDNDNGSVDFAFVEELILNFADHIFGKGSIQSRCIFRLTRNADITVDEAMFDYDIDYRVVMSELLKKRRKLAAVRLQTNLNAPDTIVKYLCDNLVLPSKQVFRQTAPLDMSAGFQLSARLSKYEDLFYPVMRPMMPKSDISLYNFALQQDVLLCYPYQSMRPFIRTLYEAAKDPDVISIKMSLYRVARESKIIEALIAAAENGKEVVTIVELRARFDEQNNIDWSKQLENAGCTVIYGFADYKVHAKMTLITRRKAGKISYYAQIGTGNYNEKTSEQYTDLSFITTNPKICEEVAATFNDLAVERLTQNTQELLVAPLSFKNILAKEMQSEIEAKHRDEDASIIIKCNSISDKDLIETISAASCEGVGIDMIVRGICCIKAGVAGKTDNVRVRSVVGRYLEHSRIYAFGKDERLRVYIASGDFLTRNTERRVEVGVKIRDKVLATNIYKYLQIQLSDTKNAWEMQPDGNYAKVKPEKEQPAVDSQVVMYEVLNNSWPFNATNNTKPQAKTVKLHWLKRIFSKK